MKNNQLSNLKGTLFTSSNLAIASNGVLAAGRIKSLNESKLINSTPLSEVKEQDTYFEPDEIALNFINKYLK